MKKLSPAQYTGKYLDPATIPAGTSVYETEGADCSLPKRKPVSHKYSYGRALIAAGTRGYAGAPALAANACERSGAGLTQLMVPESIYTIAAQRCDGAVVLPLPADGDGGFAARAADTLVQALQKANAALIGPGLGTGAGAQALVRTALREAACPLIVDADGLRVFSEDPALLDQCRAPLLLTPHEGEFRRIGGDLSQGRLAGALRFSAEHPGIVLILKGYGSLVCRGGEVAVNSTGGPAMAKGGSGDVLGGMLCALLAQGFEPWFAARCAVYLHGLSGDLAAQALGEYSLAPSDLIRFLPPAFRSVLCDSGFHRETV